MWVFERRPGGNLYVRWWDPTKKTKVKRALGHRDRHKAVAYAKELAAAMLSGIARTAPTTLTLRELFTSYEREVSQHKKHPQPNEDRRRQALWLGFLGPTYDPRSLDQPTLDRFVRARRAGAILVPGRQFHANPSDTTVGHDIVFLQSVLNWATQKKWPDGTPFFERNPVARYHRPKTKHPKRPVVTYDRYVAIKAHADEADPQRLFGAFLVLVEQLGWRVSAICQIQAGDIDRRKHKKAPYGRIRKRAETDKEGVDMWVPLSHEARVALERAQERNSVVGAVYLFPAPRRRGKPWSRWHTRDLLERAEALAELTPIEGGDWHPFRRKWATERKHLPGKDVAEAGGWKDTRTLETAYQQPDDETMLKVMTEQRKLREVK